MLPLANCSESSRKIRRVEGFSRRARLSHQYIDVTEQNLYTVQSHSAESQCRVTVAELQLQSYSAELQCRL
jgi:hypothetical protein